MRNHSLTIPKHSKIRNVNVQVLFLLPLSECSPFFKQGIDEDFGYFICKRSTTVCTNILLYKCFEFRIITFICFIWIMELLYLPPAYEKIHYQSFLHMLYQFKLFTSPQPRSYIQNWILVSHPARVSDSKPNIGYVRVDMRCVQAMYKYHKVFIMCIHLTNWGRRRVDVSGICKI